MKFPQNWSAKSVPPLIILISLCRCDLNMLLYDKWNKYTTLYYTKYYKFCSNKRNVLNVGHKWVSHYLKTHSLMD